MDKVKLTFSGDIMLNHEIIGSYNKEGKMYDFSSIFEDIKPFLEKSDFVIGNLETPISDSKDDIKINEEYTFTSPKEFAVSIKKAGFDFVSTANNHCLDNGVEGIKKTIDCLNEIGLEHTGTFYKKKTTTIENIKDIKIAILSYTYGTNAFSNNKYLSDNVFTVNLFQNQELSNPFIRTLYKSKNIIFRIMRKVFIKLHLFQLNKPIYERREKSSKHKKEIIKEIKECRKSGVDYIIMCMHEGGQYNQIPTSKTKKTVEFLKDNGIDFIIGNHEHVVNHIERYENKLVAYCLGNFVSTAAVYKEPFDKMAEYSILLHIYLTKDNEKAKMDNVTFTILKTVSDSKENNQAIKVKMLYDLIREANEEEKVKLMKDNQKIVEIVTGKKIEVNDIEKEYEICI